MYSRSSMTRVCIHMFAQVCDSYSQYCSLGLCTGTVIMSDEGQELFSKAPLTLQYTREGEGISEWLAENIYQSM